MVIPMNHDYEIYVTAAARDAARKGFSLPDLVKKTREEIRKLMPDELESVDDLEMHTFATDNGQEYVCFPMKRKLGVLVVDTCIREEFTIPTGRLAGKKMSMPKPATWT